MSSKDWQSVAALARPRSFAVNLWRILLVYSTLVFLSKEGPKLVLIVYKVALEADTGSKLMSSSSSGQLESGDGISADDERLMLSVAVDVKTE